MTTAHGASINARGGAIVSVEHRDEGRLVVVGIEAMKPDLAAMVSAVRAIPLALRDVIVVDASGLGSALWEGLGKRSRAFQLASERGLDRQRIIDPLLAAVSVADSLRFAPNLAAQSAMNRALGGFRREVSEDGLIGSELVTALALAVRAKPRVIPKVY